MNLHHLKVFLAIAQTGSISAGAARLFISQPAVTREIRELEGRLQLPLFDRQTRGVSLTEAGQRYLQRCQQILGYIEDEFNPAVDERHQSVSGAVLKRRARLALTR